VTHKCFTSTWKSSS